MRSVQRPMLVIAAFVMLAAGLLAAPQPAFAQQCINSVPQEPCTSARRNFITNPQCACCGNCQLSDFVGLAVEASRFVFGIAGMIAIAMFIYGGFLWLTSGGNADRIGKGKQTFVAAVIGLGIVFGAWAIVNTILAVLTGDIGQHGAAQILGGTWWKVPK